MLAHINHDTGETQTLENHVKEVAKFASVYSVSARLSKTAELIGLVHDMGKATDEFQKYMRENDQSKHGKINHSACGGRYISEQFSIHGKSPGELTSEIISAVVVSHHHQGLIDLISADGEDILEQKLNPNKETFYAQAQENFFNNCEKIETIKSIFDEASLEIMALHEDIISIVKKIEENSHFDKTDKTDKMDEFSQNLAIDFMLGAATRLLMSCLLDADRYDTACFMNGETAELPMSNRDLWQDLSQKLDSKLDSITPKNDIDKARANISQTCRDATKHARGIFQLSVPTGAGKTFSSLRFALNNAIKYNKDRIFYIAPFKAILEQNADEIKKILRCENLILEHHSDFLIDVENDKNRKYNDYKQHTERWNSPIILTTMVQFLNTLFLGKNRSVRRFHNLGNSVIILDEVQALPLEMTHIFTLMLNFLVQKFGVTILMCTATQPDFYNIKYPLLMNEDSQLTPNISDIFDTFKRVDIIDKTQTPFDVQMLTDFVVSLMNKHRHILVILNTKNAAKEVANSVKNVVKNANLQSEIMYITTNLCPQHRHKIIEEIKNYPKEKSLICVATNLVEAGVDFSFDCVVRSLTGLDSVVQAAGRCNRGGQKPERGEVYIVNYKDEDVSKLKAVVSSQGSSREILYKFSAKPENFSNDLISPRAMDMYYSIHFNKSKNLFDFPLEKKDYTCLHEKTDLLELLSRNGPAQREFKKKKKFDFKYPIRQSFSTAGEIFKVIDDDSEGILVAYDKGLEFINELRDGRLTSQQIYAITRKAQRYSVSVRRTDLEKLNKVNAVKNVFGVLVLDERYYDETFGLITDEQLLKSLLY
ncbi:CRISPR-associated helicase/endonuclease Cas3 [Clostridia bacterium]|nr:CRISPR-associated helicase/endonuclease Cas3 [Clostridia bacterium]